MRGELFWVAKGCVYPNLLIYGIEEVESCVPPDEYTNDPELVFSTPNSGTYDGYRWGGTAFKSRTDAINAWLAAAAALKAQCGELLPDIQQLVEQYSKELQVFKRLPKSKETSEETSIAWVETLTLDSFSAWSMLAQKILDAQPPASHDEWVLRSVIEGAIAIQKEMEAQSGVSVDDSYVVVEVAPPDEGAAWASWMDALEEDEFGREGN